MFFGVNYTDESYYFTQVIRFVSGDKPFLDTWDPLQTQGIFLIPFYYIYTLIFGYEGLLLFGRMLFFGLTLLTAILFYYAVSKKFNKSLCAISALVLVVYAPFSLYTIRYNQLLYTLGILGIIIFYIGMQFYKNQECKVKHMFFIAGIIHAAMVSSYATAVVLLPIIIILLCYYSYIVTNKNFRRAIKVILCYIGGLALIAGLLILYILIFVGLDNMLISIEGILDYSSTTHNITVKSYISNFIYVYTNYVFVNSNMRFYFIILGTVTVAFILKEIVLKFNSSFRIKSKKNILLFILIVILSKIIYNIYVNSFIEYIAIFTCIGFCTIIFLKQSLKDITVMYSIFWLFGCIIYALTHLENGILDNLMTIDIISYIACLYPLALLLTFRKEKIMRAKYDLLYLISILSLLQTLLISYSSGGFWYQGRYALVGVALFVVISLGEQINCLSIGNMNSKANARFRTIVVQVLIVVALILGQYIDVYGDNNYLKNLDEKITAGPGKGLYTSKQDADLANSLARDINKYAIEGGNLLALEVFPYAYGVNPSMKIFTQNTWAATLYTRSSYTDDIYKAPIFDYFEYKSDEPDMIFYYTDKKFWESSDPNYKMHQDIIENYNIACSNDKYTIFLKK